MRTTILHLHDSTACWTLWQGRRLLQVFCEPVTREMAEQAAALPKKDGIQSSCPWLTARAPKVRLLIDPMFDQTQTIPAFDYGFLEPKSFIEGIRSRIERMYLTCRSLTSDVLADDLTRYRREQLNRFPKAMLQWSPPNTAAKVKVQWSSAPPSWLITESGIPDFLFDWLEALSVNGLEITDVRPVSALFAIEDEKHGCPVVTVWAEPKRWRLVITSNGFVEKTEQWANEIDARIALDDIVLAFRGSHCEYKIRYIGEISDIDAWKSISPDVDFLPRENSVRTQSRFCSLAISSLPSVFCDLPLSGLLNASAGTGMKFWMNTARVDFGVSIRQLLLKTRWRRRYHRSIIATVIAATFSGYFVLLATMHALEVVELHDRSRDELQVLRGRRASMIGEARTLHANPVKAVASIDRLDRKNRERSINKQTFLSQLAALLSERPTIELNSVSWRSVQSPAAHVNVLVDIKELIDTPLNEVGSKAVEDLVLISGQMRLEHSQQEASDMLIDFLSALKTTEKVIDVIPVTHALSLSEAFNLPSDAVRPNDDSSAFVVAVRLSV